jgi:hypothetical protein
MKKKNLIPLTERTLSLIFESEEDLEQWLALYMDSGGSDACSYDVDIKESTYKNKVNKTAVMKAVGEQCPECKSTDILDQTDDRDFIQKRIDYHGKGMKLNKQFVCENCQHNFNLEEE